MKLPIFEIFIENEDSIGLALVDNPAIEKDFVYFADEKQVMTFNNEKMIVKGPALIPNKLIYRNDKLGERYIYFSEETIINFVENLMDKKENKFNIEHTENYLDATIIESYFATEPNEFNVPKNSWIVSLKIKDEDVWNKIKGGELNGFSVQGMFYNELINKFSKETNMNLELKEKILNAVNKILFGEDETKPVSGETEPVVEPVSGETEPIVEPVSGETEPVSGETEPVSGETEPVSIEKINELIIISQKETIEKMKEMINKLNEKIDSFGNLPVPSQKEKDIIDNHQPIINNPAAKYFQKRK
jgi:hypothetical protein